VAEQNETLLETEHRVYSEKEGQMTFYRRREVSLDELREAIREHRRIAGEKPASLLKNSPELLFLVENEKAKICVKQFACPTSGADERVFRKQRD